MSQIWPLGQKIPNKLAAVENMLFVLMSMSVKPTSPCWCSVECVHSQSYSRPPGTCTVFLSLPRNPPVIHRGEVQHLSSWKLSGRSVFPILGQGVFFVLFCFKPALLGFCFLDKVQDKNAKTEAGSCPHFSLGHPL